MGGTVFWISQADSKIRNKMDRIQNNQNNFEKENKGGGPVSPDFKTRKAAMKILWCWCKNRRVNRTEHRLEV